MNTREFKFRAWDNDKMLIVNTLSIASKNTTISKHFCHDTGTKEKCILIEDTAILMQYTGLKDKKGVEIYEGDILRITNHDKAMSQILKVNKSIGYMTTLGSSADNNKTCEFFSNILTAYYSIKIIGNIYENPELLEE